MVIGGRRLLVAIVVGVAGCGPAAPSPTPSSIGPSALSSASATATRTAAATPKPDALAELEVMSLDPELTDTILEFASEATSVIFSSGAADDAAPEAAPDLWRLAADAPDPVPELVWRNPNRDHSIVKLAGFTGSAVWVDIPLDGSRAWDLWLMPRDANEPILLDTHPGHEAVSSLVPSFSIDELSVAWTAFDIGPEGPVSQLWWAHGPGWEPMLLQERLAAEAELWLPSLSGARLAYAEVRYSEDRTTDTRRVYVLDLGVPGAEPVRIGRSELATMPVLAGDTLVWKEADEGFNMFNWGRLWRGEIGGSEFEPLDTAPASYVNYPSAGLRFLAWWNSDAFDFVVYDLLEQRPRVIERYAADSRANVLRPHVAGNLLVWLYVVGEGPGSEAELRWAFLPPVRSP